MLVKDELTGGLQVVARINALFEDLPQGTEEGPESLVTRVIV